MNITIQSIIDQQFTEYYKNKIGSEVLLDKEDIILSYSKDDSNIHVSALSELTNGCQHRLQLLLPYIQEYIREYHPDSFNVVVCLGDILKHQYQLPSICFSKKKSINSLLIPNIDFFTGAIYQFFQEVEQNDISFESKYDTAIFIGSSTGSFLNNTRVQFCQLSKKTQYIKSYIHNLCQADKSEWIKEYPEIESYIHPAISIKDQLKNKIVINIDGNTMCWSRLYWQMMSNSIPLYINRTQTDIQFFDYIDYTEGYISCHIDNVLDTIQHILQYQPELINNINNSGKNYIKKCFDDYIINPRQYLQNTINYILNKIQL